MRPGDIVLWSREDGDTAAWCANAAAGSSARLAREDGSGALRFDFRLEGHGAWAIARCAQPFTLPEHYVLCLALRGEATPGELQVKLVDPGGRNVWWWRRPRFEPSAVPATLVLRRASLRFAWGPLSGGDPRDVGAVEIAVASDGGAAGTFSIEALRIEPRPLRAEAPRARAIRASSAIDGHPGDALLTPIPSTDWRPEASDASPWLELDLGERREWGGLRVERSGDEGTALLQVLGSEDGARWMPLASEPSAPPSVFLRTGEAESRFVRLVLPQGLRGGIARVDVVPIELAVSPARFAAAAARTAPRGRLPRHLLGEHAYWAVVGADGDARKGILGEDGALEIDAQGFTLEPFLFVDGALVGWADVSREASLASGGLPVPTVTWRKSGLRLDITAFATGAAGESDLVARYALGNETERMRDVRLLVAVRPFQVMPEWQALNLSPAVSPITELVREGACVRVNGAHRVLAVTAPDEIGTAGPGAALGAFLSGKLVPLAKSLDPLGFAEAAFAFDLRLAPRAVETVALAVPLHAEAPIPPSGLPRAEAAAWTEAALAGVLDRWTARLSGMPIVLPPAAAPYAASLRASVAWILVNREGPRIQPGPRCYRRSWIRDGAITGTALAEMGFSEELADFLRWYAPFQYEDGRVPCAVDRSGIDRAVEHDSHGELVFGVVEHWRLTGEDGLLRALWPHVLGATRALGTLLAERKGAAFSGDGRRGLLPESISHEGYSSQPVHSYWDDFFALRAFSDAADAAAALGDTESRRHAEGLRDALRRDLRASVLATMRHHGLSVVPGSVELGDFDPTSTAICFDPCGEEALLPREGLERTFERYWEELEARRSGALLADAYSAYEIRNVVALLRLGRKERALSVLDWLVSDQRPAGWRQWPEVSTRDSSAPRFLGDLPHGWIASTFVRSLRRLLVDERRDEGVLLVAAGVPEAWVRNGDGVTLRGLPTIFGPLDLGLRAEGRDSVVARFGGACRPPGGLVFFSPDARPLREVRVDGRPFPVADPSRVTLRDVPREVQLGY